MTKEEIKLLLDKGLLCESCKKEAIKSIPIHPTEKKCPKQSYALAKLFKDAYQTYLDKNSDYSPANVVYATEIGVLIRLWDKFCRLFNLYGIEFPVTRPKLLNLIEELEDKDLSKEQIIQRLTVIAEEADFDWKNIKPKNPKNESIEDTWKDTHLYAAIGYLEFLKVWGR